MGKHKYYVVWRGRNCGVFDSWQGCKEQVDKFEGAVYKAFDTREAAVEAFAAGLPAFADRWLTNPRAYAVGMPLSRPLHRAITVDAACGGNPGDMEYRGVWLDSGQELFHSKIYREATNNIGEFLALVHALALSKRMGWTYNIFSDSMTAIYWVHKRRCNTLLKRSIANAEVFALICRAEEWLARNTFKNKIRKWETQEWGEIPADFGRK